MNANPTLEDLEYTQPYHLKYDTHTVSAPPTSRSQRSSVRMEQYLEQQLQTTIDEKQQSCLVDEIAPTPERKTHGSAKTPGSNLFANLQKEIDTAANQSMNSVSAGILQQDSALSFLK